MNGQVPHSLNQLQRPYALAESPALGDWTFGLGVVSLLQEDQRSNSDLKELRKQERVSVIYEQNGDKFVPQELDIYRLVNFLTILRFRASKREGLIAINFVR